MGARATPVERGDGRLPKPGRIERPLRLRGHVRPIKRVGQAYRATVATQPIAAKERELKQGVQSQAKPPPGTSLVVGMEVRDRMGFEESTEEVDDGAVCPWAGDARAVMQFDHDDAETPEGGCRAVLEDAVLGSFDVHLQGKVIRAGAVGVNPISQSNGRRVIGRAEVLPCEVEQRMRLGRPRNGTIGQETRDATSGKVQLKGR